MIHLHQLGFFMSRKELLSGPLNKCFCSLQVQYNRVVLNCISSSTHFLISFLKITFYGINHFAVDQPDVLFSVKFTVHPKLPSETKVCLFERKHDI